MGPVRVLAAALCLLAAATTACEDDWEGYTPNRPRDTSVYTNRSLSESASSSTLRRDWCGDEYEHAGRSFTYDWDEPGARSRAFDKHCGDLVERAVCPDDRPQAGREFTYDRGKLLSADLLAQKCGRTEAEREEERLLREAQREAGFHCLSGWDGNYDELEDLVRPQLLDPSSMDTVKTLIAPVNEEGRHAVRLVFTATNAYGATVTLTAFGLADNATCAAELLWIE